MFKNKYDHFHNMHFNTRTQPWHFLTEQVLPKPKVLITFQDQAPVFP